MKSISVSLTGNSYRIDFGSFETGVPGALHRLGFKKTKIFLIASKGVQSWARKLEKTLHQSGHAVRLVLIPNGETRKNFSTLQKLYREGLNAGLDRKSLVVAMGGGVVTDLAGFFAATYMRGIPYVSVPTSLLAMVDASIGGKTAVDLPEGKNLVGAFWQPRLVWIDTNVLRTLSKRDWITGFAEIVKYGVIKDRNFFIWLEQNVRRRANVLKWKPQDIEKAIHRSAQIKARVVSKDERERPGAGGRELLNLGHTTGHALEAATGYGKLSHGEAISIGMVVAGQLSLFRGDWSDDAQLQMVLLLQSVGLPIHFPKLSTTQDKIFWSSLLKDKKHHSGSLRFVLPKRLGHVAVEKIGLDLLKKAIRFVKGF